MQYEGWIRLKIAGIMGRGWVRDVYPVTESQWDAVVLGNPIINLKIINKREKREWRVRESMGGGKKGERQSLLLREWDIAGRRTRDVGLSIAYFIDGSKGDSNRLLYKSNPHTTGPWRLLLCHITSATRHRHRPHYPQQTLLAWRKTWGIGHDSPCLGFIYHFTLIYVAPLPISMCFCDSLASGPSLLLLLILIFYTCPQFIMQERENVGWKYNKIKI